MYVCNINSADCIASVNDAWIQFARENGAENLVNRVIGTSLWSHITNKETEHLYRDMVRKVRETQKVISVPFRCDAPRLRRYMRMKLSPMHNHGVEFCSWIERSVPMAENAGAAQELSALKGELLEMCSWCKRVRVHGRWLDIESAVESRRFFDEGIPEISHGICEDCMTYLSESLTKV